MARDGIGGGRATRLRRRLVGRRAALRVVPVFVVLATLVGWSPAIGADGGVRVATGVGLGDGVIDITATALGRMLATQAIRRYEAAGTAVAGSPALRPTDLVVLRDRSGITIGPRAAEYATMQAAGMARAARDVVPRTAAHIADPSTARAAATSVPGWQSVAGQCFSRISDGFTWLDHCYVLSRLAGESDGSRDWYALSHFATMQANVPWVMNAAQIGTAPAGPTPQDWADWQPRSDFRAACHQIVVAIVAPVPGIGDAAIQCESWTIAKSAVAGQFAVTWDGHGQRAARELSMAIAVSVPQGGWPQWFLPAWVSGSPF